MDVEEINPQRAALMRALVHLQSAIWLLDDGRAPAHIGAHVDLATCLLRDMLGSGTSVDGAKPEQ